MRRPAQTSKSSIFRGTSTAVSYIMTCAGCHCETEGCECLFWTLICVIIALSFLAGLYVSVLLRNYLLLFLALISFGSSVISTTLLVVEDSDCQPPVGLLVLFVLFPFLYGCAKRCRTGVSQTARCPICQNSGIPCQNCGSNRANEEFNDIGIDKPIEQRIVVFPGGEVQLAVPSS